MKKLPNIIKIRSDVTVVDDRIRVICAIGNILGAASASCYICRAYACAGRIEAELFVISVLFGLSVTGALSIFFYAYGFTGQLASEFVSGSDVIGSVGSGYDHVEFTNGFDDLGRSGRRGLFLNGIYLLNSKRGVS